MIECTNTFFGGRNTGIQRVARNLANRSLDMELTSAEVAPVIWAGFGFCQVRGKISPESQHSIGRKPGTEQRRYGALRWILGRLRTAIVLFDRKILRFAGNEKAHRFTEDLRHFLYCLEYLPGQLLSDGFIRFRSGDIVVLADATWNFDAMLDALFKAQKDQGIKLGDMIHDLFPLLWPDTCEEITVRRYTNWFNRIVSRADFFVTNSQATRLSLREYLDAHSQLRPPPHVIGSFRLGAELDLANEADKASWRLQPSWHLPGKVLLCVGTVEPRKNHAFLLDAFDILRQKGLDVSLIIVGRLGWKTAEILERIRNHRDFGARLLFFSDASDRLLAEAMTRSDCLICPSIAEGFGLPVVEGLVHGLEVFASDIPPFREIGGDYCRFFDLNSPTSLTDQLENWMAETTVQGVSGTKKVFSWPGWYESTRELVQLALGLAGNHSALSACDK